MTMFSVDQLLEQPHRVAQVPANEVPGLLVRLSAVMTALAARTAVSPVETTASKDPTPKKQDRNLTVGEAAELLGVKPSWLYRHSAKLPFTRRLSRRALRFSEKGLRRWLESRRS